MKFSKIILSLLFVLALGFVSCTNSSSTNSSEGNDSQELITQTTIQDSVNIKNAVAILDIEWEWTTEDQAVRADGMKLIDDFLNDRYTIHYLDIDRKWISPLANDIIKHEGMDLIKADYTIDRR